MYIVSNLGELRVINVSRLQHKCVALMKNQDEPIHVSVMNEGFEHN